MFLRSTSFINSNHEHRFLGLILLTFHIALWWDFGGVISHIFLCLHLGLFILWQPLWGMRDFSTTKNLIFSAIPLLLLIIFLNYWLISAWLAMLIGLFGGRDLARPRDRIVNAATISFLNIELLISVHQLLIASGAPLLSPHFLEMPLLIVAGSIGMIPVTFLFVGTDNRVEYRYHVDFFQGLTLTLLLMVIVLGSLTIAYYNTTIYPLAVFQMSLAMASFIFIISLLWNLFANDDNMDRLWTRHLLNVGSSFEQWLDNLAQPSNYRSLTPQQFLYTGLEQLITLPWITGITWHSLYGEGECGDKEKYSADINVQSLEIKIYSPYRISGSHYFHIKLLIQLLEYFHQAKRREDAFAQQAHLQAIYETGAKLTHDIKNLLQSLQAITSAIETCQPDQFGNTQRLLQGQMPHLAQRLKRTLDKLQRPTELSYSNVPVNLWWSNLQARYSKRDIEFFGKIDADNVLIPEDLFDNVVENLLQNALMKRKRESRLHVDVSLTISAKRMLQITVCDDGSAIPEDVVKNLLVQPVHSRDGFGIGLYQAAKQLVHSGYALHLVENKEGLVCFELKTTE